MRRTDLLDRHGGPARGAPHISCSGSRRRSRHCVDHGGPGRVRPGTSHIRTPWSSPRPVPCQPWPAPRPVAATRMTSSRFTAGTVRLLTEVSVLVRAASCRASATGEAQAPASGVPAPSPARTRPPHWQPETPASPQPRRRCGLPIASGAGGQAERRGALRQRSTRSRTAASTVPAASCTPSFSDASFPGRPFAAPPRTSWRSPSGTASRSPRLHTPLRLFLWGTPAPRICY